MWNIALNTFKEIVRNRFLYLILFFAFIFIIFSLALEKLTIGEGDKVIVDFGLAMIEIFGLIGVLFVWSQLLFKEIEGKTPNWDKDRIADVDAILLKMAICELLNFPSIPERVTINEYLEIAKEYSTPKSSIFINGILDNLVKDYKAEGKLKKVGRGLL